MQLQQCMAQTRTTQNMQRRELLLNAVSALTLSSHKHIPNCAAAVFYLLAEGLKSMLQPVHKPTEVPAPDYSFALCWLHAGTPQCFGTHNLSHRPQSGHQRRADVAGTDSSCCSSKSTGSTLKYAKADQPVGFIG